MSADKGLLAQVARVVAAHRDKRIRSALAPYSELRGIFDSAWVAEVARSHAFPTLVWWHPVFAADLPSMAHLLESLDGAIHELRAREILRVERVVARLEAGREIQNYWAARDELLAGAKLCDQYPIEFIRGDGADIAVTLPSGVVHVELTTRYSTWRFTAFTVFTSRAWAVADGDKVTLRFEVNYPSDTVAIPNRISLQLAQRLRDYIEAAEPPRTQDVVLVAEDAPTGVSIFAGPSPVNQGYIRWVPDPGEKAEEGAMFIGRDVLTEPVMEVVRQEEHHFTDEQPNVVAINLVNSPGFTAILGAPDLAHVVASFFPVNQLPATVDAVVVYWLDGGSESRLSSVILRNPASAWVNSEPANQLLSLLAEPY